MDLLAYIIEYMNNKVSTASNVFTKMYGLCDYVREEKRYHYYTGGGSAKPVTDYDHNTGNLLWVKTGDVTIGDAPALLQDISCENYVAINYPLRAVCVVQKSSLPCDNATAVDQIAQELLHKLGGKDKILRKAVGASFLEIRPIRYGLLRDVTENLKYASFFLDYTVQVVLKKSCIPQLCEDVPLPTCNFSVRLNNANGLTIYTITQDTANPFTLASQLVIDGNGNEVSVPYNPTVPYVTEACSLVCDDATVNVNSNLFNTVVSGGTINVPVQYENGTPVGTIDGGVVEIPNPITCADAEAVLKNTAGTTISTTDIPSGGSDDIIAPDATAVLKDTAGNILDTEAIPSNVSEDLTAPDGNITVNGVAFDTVLSGGTTDVEVRQQSGSTQVGSKQGQYWRINDSDISINGTPFDSVAAEGSIDIDVQYANGTPVGSDISGVWTIPNPVQDLVTIVDFQSGATPLEYTITINSLTAGTYTTESFSGDITDATYEVNGSPATLPITVVATDTLKITPDSDNGTVTLTGTYV
jgi:hypothetical protein